jgi:hypothetical protein
MTAETTARTRSALLTFLLGCCLGVAGCGGPPEQPAAPSPPVGPVVSPRPIAVEWANTLCTTLNPVFDALARPAAGTNSAAGRQSLLDQVTEAQAALQRANAQLHVVGPAPAKEGMTLIERVDDRLDALARELDVAAAGLRAVDPSDPAAVEEATRTAQHALRSFDRAALEPLLEPDPAVQNALAFAPACTRQ